MTGVMVVTTICGSLSAVFTGGEERACKLYSRLADVYVANNFTGVMVVDTHWGCQSDVFIGGPEKLSIT